MFDQQLLDYPCAPRDGHHAHRWRAHGPRRGQLRPACRALLHTRPLHALRLKQGKPREGKFEPYDLLTLQLAAIEHITDHQSPNRGVPVEEVEDELARVAGAMAPKRPRSEHREVAVVCWPVSRTRARARSCSTIATHQSLEWQRTDVRLLNADQADDGSIESAPRPRRSTCCWM